MGQDAFYIRNNCVSLIKSICFIGSFAGAVIFATSLVARADFAIAGSIVDRIVETTGSTQLVNPAKDAAASEAQVLYRVHRSPVRDDSLTFMVVSLDTNEEKAIDLPGIAGFSFNTVCRTETGGRIACGSRARIALVNRIARQDISCRFRNEPGKGERLVGCSVRGEDLGEWIVRSGIGRPTGEESYAGALREARTSLRGMWVDADTRARVRVAQN